MKEVTPEQRSEGGARNFQEEAMTLKLQHKEAGEAGVWSKVGGMETRQRRPGLGLGVLAPIPAGHWSLWVLLVWGQSVHGEL